MSVNLTNHWTAHIGGALVEFGKAQFSGTAMTVDIPCSMAEPTFAAITAQVTTNSQENYSVDLSSRSGGQITVNRAVHNRVASFQIDQGQFDESNLPFTPLMIAQRAMRMVQYEWYHGTSWNQGTPVISFGSSTDADSLVATAAITTPTTDAATTTITSATSGWTLATVADGVVIGATITGGIAATSTQTTTRTSTGTLTSTATRTKTRTSTSTRTFTFSQSVSVSAAGVSDTRTFTMSTSVSATNSNTASVSATPSPSVSISPTASISASPESVTQRPADCCITIQYMTPEPDLWISYVLFGIIC